MVDSVNGANSAGKSQAQGNLNKLNNDKAEKEKLNQQIQNAFYSCNGDSKCQKKVYDLAEKLSSLQNEINMYQTEMDKELKSSAPKYTD